jgi:hypothetical protein
MSRALSGTPDTPVFFVSYRRPYEPGSPTLASRPLRPEVRQFFQDLTEDVGELIGAPLGHHLGYLDRADSVGVGWERHWLTAIGTCQVLICLMSEPLLRDSKWCAREWHAFARRRVSPNSASALTGGSPIVPVIWLPSTILFSFRRWCAVVWKIAMHVNRVRQSCVVMPDLPADISTLPTSFGEAT